MPCLGTFLLVSACLKMMGKTPGKCSAKRKQVCSIVFGANLAFKSICDSVYVRLRHGTLLGDLGEFWYGCGEFRYFCFPIQIT